jgi:uncharacterized membrane protein
MSKHSLFLNLLLGFSLSLHVCGGEEDPELLPAVNTAGDMTNAPTREGGVVAGAMNVGGESGGDDMMGGVMVGGTTAGETTPGGIMSGGTMTGGQEGGSTIVPPMDDAGRCFESCLALLAC